MRTSAKQAGGRSLAPPITYARDHTTQRVADDIFARTPLRYCEKIHQKF